MSKKLIIILAAVALLGAGAWFYSRRPVITIESVNFLGKRITFKMSAGGYSRAGSLVYGEILNTGGNGYELIADNTGTRYATFQIKKDGKLLKELKVDFLKKAVELGTGTWSSVFGENSLGDA